MDLALVNFTGVLRLIDNPLLEYCLGTYSIKSNTFINQYKIIPFCVTNLEVPYLKKLSKAKSSFIEDCSYNFRNTLRTLGSELYIFRSYKDSLSLLDKYQPSAYITRASIHLPDRGETSSYKSIFKKKYIEVSGSWNSIDLVKVLNSIAGYTAREIPYDTLSDILNNPIVFRKPSYCNGTSFIEVNTEPEEAKYKNKGRKEALTHLATLDINQPLDVGKYLATGVISSREVLQWLINKPFDERIIELISKILRRDLASINILKNGSLFIKERTNESSVRFLKLLSLNSEDTKVNSILESLMVSGYLSLNDRIELVKFFKAKEIPLFFLKLLLEVYLLDFNPFITDYSIYLNL